MVNVKLIKNCWIARSNIVYLKPLIFGFVNNLYFRPLFSSKILKMYILDHYYHDNLFKVYILDPIFDTYIIDPALSTHITFPEQVPPPPAAYNYLDPMTF